MTNNTDKVKNTGQMVHNMKEPINMVKKKDLVILIGQTAQATKETL